MSLIWFKSENNSLGVLMISVQQSNVNYVTIFILSQITKIAS